MGRDWSLPKFMARLHPAYATPWVATLVVLIYGVVGGFVLFGPVKPEDVIDQRIALFFILELLLLGSGIFQDLGLTAIGKVKSFNFITQSKLHY